MKTEGCGWSQITYLRSLSAFLRSASAFLRAARSSFVSFLEEDEELNEVAEDTLSASLSKSLSSLSLTSLELISLKSNDNHSINTFVTSQTTQTTEIFRNLICQIRRSCCRCRLLHPWRPSSSFRVLDEVTTAACFASSSLCSVVMSSRDYLGALHLAVVRVSVSVLSQ